MYNRKIAPTVSKIKEEIEEYNFSEVPIIYY
jgi:hypothetical protein